MIHTIRTAPAPKSTEWTDRTEWTGTIRPHPEAVLDPWAAPPAITIRPVKAREAARTEPCLKIRDIVQPPDKTDVPSTPIHLRRRPTEWTEDTNHLPVRSTAHLPLSEVAILNSVTDTPTTNLSRPPRLPRTNPCHLQSRKPTNRLHQRRLLQPTAANAATCPWWAYNKAPLTSSKCHSLPATYPRATTWTRVPFINNSSSNNISQHQTEATPPRFTTTAAKWTTNLPAL